jgi:sulfur relay protein TusB/DsrH
MLHIVNQSVVTASQIALIRASDAVLLIEDGVYCGVATACETLLQRTQNCYALLPDVAARGLSQKMHEGIQLISYADFVDLSLAHSPVISW